MEAPPTQFPVCPYTAATYPYPSFGSAYTAAYSNPYSTTYPHPPPASAYTAATGTTPTGHLPVPVFSYHQPFPTFPYAAPLPYAPPPPGFFSAPAYGPSSSPSESTAPPATQSSPSILSLPLSPGVFHTTATAAPSADIFPGLSHIHEHQFAPPPDHLPVEGVPQTSATCAGSYVSSPSPRRWTSSLLALSDADTPTHQHSNSSATAYHAASTTAKPWVDSAPNAAVPAVADERVTATDVSLHQLQRELLDMQVRLCQQQARQQTSFNTLQGELAKLKPRVSQCTVPMGKQSSAAASSSPSSDRSQFGTSSTANVAPMVFGEMPTPISGHGTQSPPKQTSAAENLRVAAQWSVGAQAEGLATVNCFKTNNSDDYEPRLGHLVKLPIIVQDVPNVKKEMPVHDAYEEEQQDSEQPPKCSSESTKDSLLQVVTGLAFPEEGEAHATRYIKFTHGQDIQEIVVSDLAPGYAKDSACLKITSDVQDFSFSWLSIDQSMRDLKLQWDPGASAFLVAPLKNDSSKDFSSHNKTDLWSQYEHLLIMFRGVFDEVMLAKPPAKPPDWFGIADSSLQDICFLLEVTPSGKRGAFSLKFFAISALWRNATLTGHKLFGVQILAANSFNMSTCTSVSDTQHICIFVKLWPWSIFSAQHILDSSMKKYIIFSSGRILAGNPWSAILPLHYFLWEFSTDKVLSKTTVLNLMDLKHFWAPLLHSWCTIRMSFLQDEYCCLPFVLDCSYSEQVQQLVWYSCMFSTPEAMSTATKLQCRDTYKSTMVQIVVVQFSARMTSIFGPTIMHSYSSGLGWTKVNAAALHVLAVPYSEVTPLAKHYLSLLSQDTQEQDQLLKDNEQTSTYCSRASEHALNCQHSLMSTTVTPQVQSQAIERKPVYDAYNEEDNACLNSVDAVLVHNSEQQKVTNASFVWDPGTMLLWYKCKWCLLYTDEKINWLTEIKCYGVALWLIHFHPP